MPELPEVETVVRGLKPLEGKVLKRIVLQDPKVWFESEYKPEAFRGRSLESVRRRGKYIILDFGPHHKIMQHLRMTGKILPSDSTSIPGHLRNSKQGKLQIRADFDFQGARFSFYDTRRFGTLTAVKDEEAYFKKKKLAPDPLLDSVRAFENFCDRIKSKKPKAKAALLDQSVVAGVGNIYADEILFLERINPAKKFPIEKLKERFWENLREIFLKSIENGGTTILNYTNAEGKKGGNSPYLKVYGRENEGCFSCGTIVRRKILVGRSTFYCPVCQK